MTDNQLINNSGQDSILTLQPFRKPGFQFRYKYVLLIVSLPTHIIYK